MCDIHGLGRAKHPSVISNVPRKIQVVVALDGLRLVTHSDLLDGNLLAQSRETNSSS